MNGIKEGLVRHGMSRLGWASLMECDTTEHGSLMVKCGPVDLTHLRRSERRHIDREIHEIDKVPRPGRPRQARQGADEALRIQAGVDSQRSQTFASNLEWHGGCLVVFAPHTCIFSVTYLNLAPLFGHRHEPDQ